MCGAKGQTTQNTSYTPDETAMAYYRDVLARAGNVGELPYQSYGGQMVAPFNAQQMMGVGSINQYANAPMGALSYATAAAQPISEADIRAYMNPYQNQVVGSTLGAFDLANRQQQANLTGNLISQNALGGNRAGVAQANLASLQSAQQLPMIAQLYSQGYQSSLGAAQAEKMRQLQAAYGIGQVGAMGQQAGAMQLGAGSQMQQTQQAENLARFQEFMRQQAFPYQQAQWMAGIGQGIGSQMGGQGTAVTQAPAPSPFAQLAGLGMGLYGLTGGAGIFRVRDGGAVRGYDLGGGVEGGIPPMPYAGVPGFIPAGQMAPPQDFRANLKFAPSAEEKQSSPADMMNMAKMLAGTGQKAGVSAPTNINAPGMGFAPGVAGDIQPIGVPTGLDPIYARGGGVRGYARGGLPVQEYAPDAYNPIDAELVERERASGVAPPPPASFDDRFNAIDEKPLAPPPWVSDAVSADRIVPRPLKTERIIPEAPPMAAGVASRTVPSVTPAAAGVAPPMAFAEEAPSRGLAPPERKRNMWGLPALSDEARTGIMAAGLGMMASRSPYFGVAVGEGGLMGVGAYGQVKAQQRAERKEAREERKVAETERYHRAMVDRQMMRPVPLGVDRYGQQIFGIPDTKNPGKFTPIDPNTGMPRPGAVSVSPGDRSADDISTRFAAEEAELPKGASLVEFIESGRVMQDPAAGDYRQDVMRQLMADDPKHAGVVKAIAEGRRQMPSVNRNNPYARRLQEDVLAYNPSFDETLYGQRKRTAGDFTTGVVGRNVIALGTLGGHLGSLYESALKLNNRDWSALNAARNTVTYALGMRKYQAALDDYRAKAEAVANEGPKVFAGTTSALADREEWRKKLLNENKPISGQLASIRSIVDLVDSRSDEIQTAYNRGMATNRQRDDFVSPKHRQLYDYMRRINPEDPEREQERWKQFKASGFKGEKATVAPASAILTPTQADIDYAKANPSVRDKFIKRFGREP